MKHDAWYIDSKYDTIFMVSEDKQLVATCKQKCLEQTRHPVIYTNLIIEPNFKMDLKSRKNQYKRKIQFWNDPKHLTQNRFDNP